MQDLRQSTASQVISLGQFLDSTDGDTEENGLTIANTDIKLRKNAAITLVNKNSGGATNISNGVYHATLNATDSNTLGRLEIYVHVAGALAVKAVFRVLTATAFDAIYTGTFNNLGGVAQSADNDTKISLIPTTAMRGTDSAATSAKQDTMETTLNAIPTTAMRGTDGANTVVPDAAGVAPTAVENRQEMDTNSLDLDSLISGQSTINSNVLLIDTATMRGTDGANTVVPDAAGTAPTVAEIFAGGDVDGFSLENALKLILSASVGVLAGAATNSITIQAADGTKTRITATVDSDGNRSAVIKDVTG